LFPSSFEYVRAGTISEAVSLLEQHGEDAKILSGGQSLIPMMKLRVARPSWLIDIGRVPGLKHIQEAGGHLRIGALVRESDLETSELIRSKYAIIHDTTMVIADPLVRNLATVGGNLAHGDPGNDHPATMLALGAKVVAVGPRGEREIPIADFFVSIFTTALEHNEILTEIRIPSPPPRNGGAYLKLERKVGDYATAAVAVQLALDSGRTCRTAGIGLTNVGPTPLRATQAEDFLRGRKLDDAAIDQAAQLAADAAQPSSDLRGPADFKKALVKEFTKRGLKKAMERAGGN
jgi:aerobic carbon-monoxide dehydrogenase medium subunit